MVNDRRRRTLRAWSLALGPAALAAWLPQARATEAARAANRTNAEAVATGTPAGTTSTAAGSGASPAHPWLPQSRRIGQGTLRVLGFSVYDASLYALPDFAARDFAAHPLLLEIHYRRAFTGAAIADYSLAQMRRGTPTPTPAPDEATAERWLQFMRRAFPDVRPGDRLTGSWQPEGGVTRFAANEAAPVELRDAAFGPRFFGIWLGTDSPRPDLRAQLLGLDAGTAGAR